MLAALPAGFEPLVVDNGSTDGSAEVARRLGARVVSEPRRGFGAACWAGLSAARSELVCFMDCDGSLDPGELPAVADPVAGRDAGPVPRRPSRRRRAPGRRTRGWPTARSPGSCAAAPASGSPTSARCAARRASGCWRSDCATARFGWPLEMVLRAAAAGWRIGEAPVAYRPRAGGESKVSGSVRGSLRAVRDMSAVLRSGR